MVMRRPLSNENATNRGDLPCESEGCGQRAVWWVRTPAGVWKARCEDCRDELVAVYGHELMEPM